MTHPNPATPDAAVVTAVPQPAQRIGPAEAARITTVVEMALRPGMVLIGPTERTYVRHCLYPQHVIPAHGWEDGITHQLLDWGWLRRGDRDTVARHRPGDSARDPAPHVTATVVGIHTATMTRLHHWLAELSRSHP